MELDSAELLDLAAQKIANAFLGEHGESLESRIDEEVSKLISDDVRASVSRRIDQRMQEEVESVLSAEICPVDMWGESTGDPTTIRDQITKRAIAYWNEKVEPDRNNRGQWVVSTGWGGTPRHKAVFESVAAEAFKKAIAENVTEIVTAFKSALSSEAGEFVTEQIERHIKVPGRR